jgi:hypothetical protein
MKNYYDSGGRVEPPEPGELADDDLLAVLSTMDARLADSVSGEAIGTESLRQRVSVMRHRPRPGDRVRPEPRPPNARLTPAPTRQVSSYWTSTTSRLPICPVTRAACVSG